MYRDEFKLDPSLIYLNHAAVAPWPRRTCDAVSRFADENSTHGATHYPEWMKVEQQLHEQFQWLINAQSVDDIAIQKSTSEALSVIAYGLEWQAGQNVVIFKQEFPSNRVVWQSLERFGVECRLVDLAASENPEQQLLAQCDEHTRLISVSSVQYASGLQMDLPQIGAYCREKGILFCVDAIQSLGALPFDVQEIEAHFVVADGHKWMLGPEGVALLYTHPDLCQTLKLNQFGWHMLASPGDYDSLQTRPANSARRFECGSPNMLGIHALSSSLSLIREVGLEQISQAIYRNTKHLNQLIEGDDRLDLISSSDPQRMSGIVTFRVREGDHSKIHAELMKRGVICACRGGGIRFSPHFYTTEQKLTNAMQILDQIISNK